MRKKKNNGKITAVLLISLIFVIALVYVSTFAVEVDIGQVEEDVTAKTIVK